MANQMSEDEIYEQAKKREEPDAFSSCLAGTTVGV